MRRGGELSKLSKYFQKKQRSLHISCTGADVSFKEPNRGRRSSKEQKGWPITGHTSPETTKDPIILPCEAKKGLDRNQVVEGPVLLYECTKLLT